MPVQAQQNESRLAGFHAKSTDDIGDAVKSPALPVSTFHGFSLGKINFFCYPAFCTVRERRGCYKPVLHFELPAVHAEPAVLHWLFLVCKTLHFSLYHRNNTVFSVSHGPISPNFSFFICCQYE